jgi:hypothetical protein
MGASLQDMEQTFAILSGLDDADVQAQLRRAFRQFAAPVQAGGKPKPGGKPDKRLRENKGRGGEAMTLVEVFLLIADILLALILVRPFVRP